MRNQLIDESNDQMPALRETQTVVSICGCVCICFAFYTHVQPDYCFVTYFFCFVILTRLFAASLSLSDFVFFHCYFSMSIETTLTQFHQLTQHRAAMAYSIKFQIVLGSLQPFRLVFICRRPKICHPSKIQMHRMTCIEHMPTIAYRKCLRNGTVPVPSQKSMPFRPWHHLCSTNQSSRGTYILRGTRGTYTHSNTRKINRKFQN